MRQTQGALDEQQRHGGGRGATQKALTQIVALSQCGAACRASLSQAAGALLLPHLLLLLLLLLLHLLQPQPQC